MSYSNVIPSRYLASAIRYSMNGAGHNGNAERVLCCTGVNMNNSEQSTESFIKQMSEDLKKAGREKAGRKIQCYRVLQSFSHNELSDSNYDDIRACHELGIRLAKQLYPDYKALVITQADGNGKCLHNHITVVNARSTDGRCCRGKQTRWLNGVKPYSDAIAKDNL